eukprot:TRINITY_DN18020_c0_g1_i1.p1 TRINITY_DN18020_c0_g1~~TRINITY_DN18020_c0_g1_i1.p1  ORF type:complete len:198 (+),score=36.11 TRINITY_DN18020_c0_g1_i1:52-645(+)
MLCCGSAEMMKAHDDHSEADVYLNVYDITSMNVLIGNLGMGAYHTGVEIYGREYCFGRAPSDCSGVYHILPKTCSEHVFRESILLGRSRLSFEEVDALIKSIEERYLSTSYHVVRLNCNTFSEEFSHKLLEQQRRVPYPSWVNRPCCSAAWLLPDFLVEKIDQIDYEMFLKNCPPDDDEVTFTPLSDEELNPNSKLY